VAKSASIFATFFWGNDGQPVTASGGTLVDLADYRRRSGRVFFDRQELRKILNLYSTRVARGEWRDYAIDVRDNLAAFSVFRHTRDWPLYVIAKIAPGKHRQGGYVVSAGHRTLSRGRSLDDVLAALEQALEPA
jgi:hypothetical protein